MFSLQHYQVYGLLSQLKSASTLSQIENYTGDIREALITDLVTQEVPVNSDSFKDMDNIPSLELLSGALALKEAVPAGIREDFERIALQTYHNPVWHDVLTAGVTDRVVAYAAGLTKTQHAFEATPELWYGWEEIIPKTVLEMAALSTSRETQRAICNMVTVYLSLQGSLPVPLYPAIGSIENDILIDTLLEEYVPGFLTELQSKVLLASSEKVIHAVLDKVMPAAPGRQATALLDLFEESPAPLSLDMLKAVSAILDKTTVRSLSVYSAIVDSVLSILAEHGEYTDSVHEAIVPLLENGILPVDVLRMYQIL